VQAPGLAAREQPCHAIRALVRAGFGVSFMPASYAAWGTGVSFVPVEGGTSKQQLACSRSSNTDLHRHFLKAARPALQDAGH
jgi:DNA-binding transcriptional LysR family regulator